MASVATPVGTTVVSSGEVWAPSGNAMVNPMKHKNPEIALSSAAMPTTIFHELCFHSAKFTEPKASAPLEYQDSHAAVFIYL
jgi:hypothetical protein